MRKFLFYKNGQVDSIVELIERSGKLYGDSTAIKYKEKKTLYKKTYNDILNDSRGFAHYLLNQPISKGHIGVIGPSGYDWIITYLGTVFAGMVIVPLDKELPPNELCQLIIQADVDYLFYDEQYYDIIESLKKEYNLKISFLQFEKSLYLEDKKTSIPIVEPDKLSSILFTSGTMGNSKGVMLTQRNIARNVIQGLGAVNLQHEKDVIISVLPLNHAYEFTCTILGMIYKGVPICISSGLKYIQKEFIEFKPTVMFIVPLLAEKLYEKIELAVKKQRKDKMFSFALKLSGFFKKFKIDLSDRLFSEVKSAFGGKLKILMCGGAPLNEELINKFNCIGINLFQGYGLTECSPLLTVNFDYYHRPNSVGKVVQGNTVKIVNGEIWAKGVSVSQGYYNNSEETEKSFENGWFKTGDLGTIDKDGFVFITGRKKNLIILNNGKNVSAEELETLIYKIPSVAEVLVYGKDERIVAEIYSEPENAIDLSIINEEIQKINRSLPSYKNIDQVLMRDTPFDKTTTKKIKRFKQTEA